MTPAALLSRLDIAGIADAAVATGLHDVDLVVDYIDAQVSDIELRDAFRFALRQVAVSALNRPRRSIQRAAQNPGVNTSRKWQSASSLYRNWLAADVAVPGAGHKALGDCDIADCRAVSAHHVKMAATLSIEGQRFEMLAKRLASHKVATVKQLPEKVARDIMSWIP